MRHSLSLMCTVVNKRQNVLAFLELAFNMIV